MSLASLRESAVSLVASTLNVSAVLQRNKYDLSLRTS